MMPASVKRRFRGLLPLVLLAAAQAHAQAPDPPWFIGVSAGQTWFDTSLDVDQGNIDHHSMSVYLGLIRAKIKSPQRVPYKVDLNLFNLFGNE